jgi:hypothetical protein
MFKTPDRKTDNPTRMRRLLNAPRKLSNASRKLFTFDIKPPQLIRQVADCKRRYKFGDHNEEEISNVENEWNEINENNVREFTMPLISHDGNCPYCGSKNEGIDKTEYKFCFACDSIYWTWP